MNYSLPKVLELFSGISAENLHNLERVENCVVVHFEGEPLDDDADGVHVYQLTLDFGRSVIQLMDTTEKTVVFRA